MRALLISTYELGRQPFGLASPAAWLRREGFAVDCLDATRDPLTADLARRADLVAFHLPMHTATRLAGPLIRDVRAVNPSARVCAYGLYAPLNAAWLTGLGVDDILGGEFEEDLARLARDLGAARARSGISTLGNAARPADAQQTPRTGGVAPGLPRLRFLVPDRSGLPPLARYAALALGDGRQVPVGYTEASRGCRHLCRHCPIVPIYQGQFRIVQPDVVLADVAGQVAAGAGHVTFGDPDFFNGPTHALRIVEGLHAAWPGLTYDVTIKVEHLLRHRALLPRLRDTGCRFITTAVESLDDRVLALLDKGHTRQDFLDAVALCRDVGVTLTPTFVAFHPWITLEGYNALLDTIDALDLVAHVAPVQLAVRLLVPDGSRLLDLAEVRALVQPFDAATLTWPWRHEDPRVDDLHRAVTAVAAASGREDRGEVFDDIRALARRHAGLPPAGASRRAPVAVPHLTEPWYCCAEPGPEQMV
jgi:radical SAM superfamily enzyme YgiQ (UPF0313 family)